VGAVSSLVENDIRWWVEDLACEGGCVLPKAVEWLDLEMAS